MSSLAAFASDSVCRTLALSLIHSLWQGTLVALLLWAANLVLRLGSARARYAAACAALALMLALPAATFWRLETRASTTPILAPLSAVAIEAAAAPLDPSARSHARKDSLAVLAPWIVLGWLTGVSLLSIRFLGGCFAARRLARRQTRRPDAAWEARLAELAQRLGVGRTIRLLESALVEVPTAIGIVSPVILVPAGIATGMAPDQLESLLAHELAHIRRGDWLINVCQALAETLFFYHPAVWWASSRIRIEREHVCDDLAVAATGDAIGYARALLDLEERRRKAFALAVAADGGHLWSRITRLVQPQQAQAIRSPRWLAGALALGAVLALGAAAQVPSGDARRPVETAPASPPQAEPEAKPSPSPEAEPRGARRKAEPEPHAANAPAAARGLLSPEDLIAFRIHGVTPEFVGEIIALGYTRSSPEELVALRIHGVTPEYIQKMSAIFGKLPLQRYVEFRIHGLDPESVHKLEALFGKLSPDDALSMRIHGVDAGQVAAFRDAGYGSLSAEEAVSLRIHGVTPEWARAIRAQGFPDLSIDDLLAFRIHGVTPEYVAAIRALGYASLSADDVTAFRIHGLTPDSIRALNKKAGEQLSADELIEWRLHDRRSVSDKED